MDGMLASRRQAIVKLVAVGTFRLQAAQDRHAGAHHIHRMRIGGQLLEDFGAAGQADNAATSTARETHSPLFGWADRPIQQQKRHLTKGRPLGQLVQRIAAVTQTARLFVDLGNRGLPATTPSNPFAKSDMALLGSFSTLDAPTPARLQQFISLAARIHGSATRRTKHPASAWTPPPPAGCRRGGSFRYTFKAAAFIARKADSG
jgi:hypothetical protein